MSAILESAPNPIFARDAWIDLTGPWRFRYDDRDEGLTARWWDASWQDAATIVVPFPPESEMSGINDPSNHPVVWYQRELPAAADNAADRTLIHFGAVDYAATIWVNGILQRTHAGGSSPFTVDLPTDLLRHGAATLTMRVFDDPVSLEQPRGKQSWTPEPDGIFYKRTTGIWQPVWMEFAPATYIDYVRLVFEPATTSLSAYIELNRTPDVPVEVTISVAETSTATIVLDGRFGNGRISLDPLATEGSLDAVLWSPDSPTLFPVLVSTPDGDTVHSYVGLRTVELDKGGFSINGTRHWMRMVLSQGYFPESLYASPSIDAARKEVEVTLALGFNGARLHQKAEDPRYLYWADKMGLMLWGEIGAAYVWSDLAVERLSNEWRELVRRDINRPSIIAWVPFNESWGIGEIDVDVRQQHGVRALYALTYAIDGTRPVIGNDGWEHVASDIFSLHDYTWDLDELRGSYASGRANSDIATTFHTADKVAIASADFDADARPIMVTEYGGVSFAPADDESWYGYGKVRTNDEFADTYRGINQALHDSDELIGVCYTQLTDTEQETNGLLREDRTPKLDLKTLAAITRGNKADA